MRHDPARRALLARAVLLAGVGALPLGCRECGRTEGAEHALTLDRRSWQSLELATSRILPTDDLPGAREANVIGFIDRQLALPHLAVFKTEVLMGVGVLDALTRARFERDFADVGDGERDQVLTALAAGDGTMSGFSAAHFFDVLFTLTLEGAFSDPVHGGNRDQAGWTLLGYVPDGPRPGGHEHSHG